MTRRRNLYFPIEIEDRREKMRARHLQGCCCCRGSSAKERSPEGSASSRRR